MKHIVNRVKKSSIESIDLIDLYIPGERVLFDIKKWLYEETVLKEKDFRKSLSSYDWKQFEDKYVAFTCSSNAIIPSWAYLLLTTKAYPYVKKCVVGNLKILETILYAESILKFDVSPFRDKLIIIKGCSEKPIPESAYTLLIQKLLPIAKSIMYGEACSSVPLYKKKNTT